MDINDEELKIISGCIKYDPETGDFIALTERPHIKKGDKLGCLCKQSGYIKFRVNGNLYLGHRVAWALHYGSWPKDMIDHINGIKSDNRISNLRECTNSQNMMNVGRLRNNTSGHKGVVWCKRLGKWRVQIQVNKRTATFGRHDDYELACLIADAAREKYHGEFFSGANGKP